MLEAATKAGSGSAERRENGLGERVRSRRGRKARRHGDCASLADHAGDLTYLHPGGERRCHWRVEWPRPHRPEAPTARKQDRLTLFRAAPIFSGPGISTLGAGSTLPRYRQRLQGKIRRRGRWRRLGRCPSLVAERRLEPRE